MTDATPFLDAANPLLPDTKGLVELSDNRMIEIRNLLLKHEGNLDAAGITLDEMRNALFTRRMKANPMQSKEGPSVAKPAKDVLDLGTEPKAPKAKREKITGVAVDDFLS